MNFKREYMGLAMKHYEEKKYFYAIDMFQKVLTLGELTEDLPAIIEAREYIARSYFKLNRFIEALNHFYLLQNYALSQEKQITITTLKGISYNYLGQFDQAIETLNSLQEFNSSIAYRKMHVNLGVIYYRLYKYRNQQDALEKSLTHYYDAEKFPLDSIVANKLYRNIGISLMEQGKYLDSLQMFEKSLDYTEDQKEIFYTKIEMANTHLHMEEYQKAEHILDDAYTFLSSINDRYGLGHTFLTKGLNQFKQGNSQLGEDLINQAIEHFLALSCFPEVSDCFLSLTKEFKNYDPSKSDTYYRIFEQFYAKFL